MQDVVKVEQEASFGYALRSNEGCLPYAQIVTE